MGTLNHSFGPLGKCGTCAKPVTVEGCTAFGKVYHKECFKCCVCRKRIDGKFFEKNGKPYCSKDYEVTPDPKLLYLLECDRHCFLHAVGNKIAK